MEGGGVGWWGRVTGVWVDRGAVWRNGGVWHQARINDRTKGLLPASGGRRERERGPRGGVAPLMHSKSTHCLQGDAASVNHTVQKGETDMWRHTVWHHRPQTTVTSSKWTGVFLTHASAKESAYRLIKKVHCRCVPATCIHIYTYTRTHTHTGLWRFCESILPSFNAHEYIYSKRGIKCKKNQKQFRFIFRVRTIPVFSPSLRFLVSYKRVINTLCRVMNCVKKIPPDSSNIVVETTVCYLFVWVPTGMALEGQRQTPRLLVYA